MAGVNLPVTGSNFAAPEASVTALARAWQGEKSIDPVKPFLLSCRLIRTSPVMKGDDSMDLPRVGSYIRVTVTIVIVLALIIPATLWAQNYKEFVSDEYGFAMKYPASWVKIDKPKGNYYVVFQSPDLVDNFRPRIHVAAHKPVKDPISVFLQEFRNGIKDLQKPAGTEKADPRAKGAARQEKQEVRILDEGEFKSEIPGAYYFFIQALEDKLKIWMDIVIVFYKQDQTLLRISCLAPSSAMEKFHQMFNDVLVSVKFTEGAAQLAPPPRTIVPAPPPSAAPPPSRPSPPAMAPEPAPEIRTQPPGRPAPPAPAPKAGPRGPAREPERPATGIVN